MKAKILFLSTLLTTTSTVAFAQKGFNFGVHAEFIGDQAFGAQFSHAEVPTEECDPDLAFNNGFTYGIKARYGFDENWGFASGLTKGSRFIYVEVERENPRINNSRNGGAVDFFEIPLKLTYKSKLSTNSQWEISGHLGSAISFWSPASFDGSFAVLDPNKNTLKDHETNIQARKTIIGLTYGIGMEKSLDKYGSLYLGVSVRSQLNKKLRWHSSIMRERTSYKSGMFKPNFLGVDVTYYLPWRF